MTAPKSETAVERVCRRLDVTFGGLAEICGVDVSTPCAWNLPLDRKNGRGGAIPDRYHRRILDYARRAGIDFKPGDLVNV